MVVGSIPDTGSRSAAAVLKSLQADAEHKASLWMYFAAADLYRCYNGPFADETRDERTRLAIEYEKLGVTAEQERKEHGTISAAHPAPPVNRPVATTLSWHCPACHTAFPEGLVICGKCGLDLRTGKPYAATIKKPKFTPRVVTGSPPVTRPHHHFGHAKRRPDYTVAWLTIGVIVGLFALLLLLGIAKGPWTAPRVPLAPHPMPR